MAVELATGFVTIVPDTSKVARGIRQALGQADKMGDKTGQGLGTRITKGLSKTLKIGAASTGAAVGGVLAASITKGVGRLTALDNAQSMMRGLKMSSDEVARSMDGVSASVKGTAFGLDEAAGSAAKLTSVGIAVGTELDRSLKLTADIAAQGQTSMDDISSIMAKVAGAGKVTGETLAQLDDRATGASSALSKHLGVSIDEVRDKVSKGEIDFETFQTAMEEHLGGAALRTGETVQGAFKNMGAAMGRFGAHLAEPVFASSPAIFGAVGKAFDAMDDAIKPVSEKLTASLTPAFEQVAGLIENKLAPALGAGAGKLGELVVKLTDKAVDPSLWAKVGDVFTKIKDAASELWPTVKDLGEAIFEVSRNISVATWQALGDVLNEVAPIARDVLVPVLQQVADFMKDHPGLVESAVKAYLGFKVVKSVAGPVGKFASTVQSLGSAFGTASKMVKIAGIGGALKSMTSWAKAGDPVFRAVGTGIEKIGKGAAVAGKFLGPLAKGIGFAVSKMNPWVAAITAVAGGLTWFFTQTETGRAMWESFTNFLVDAWNLVSEKLTNGWQWMNDNVFTPLKGAWDAISGAMQTAWDSVIAPVLDAFWQVAQVTIGVIATAILAPLMIQWKAMSEVISWAWENIIKPAWDALKGAAMSMWNDYLKPTWDAIKLAWSAMGDWIQQVWQATILVAWEAMKLAARVMWENVLRPVWEAIKGAWTALADAIKAAWDTVINPAWEAIKNAARFMWENVLSPTFQLIQDGWQKMASGIELLRAQYIQPAFEKVKEGVSAVKDRFHSMVDAIAQKWATLRRTLAEPINFMIDNVYNDGILRAWNVVAAILPGLETGERIPGIRAYATGGAIRGPGSGTSDDVLMWGSNGEHMLTAAEVTRLGGQSAVYAMRAMIREGRSFTVDPEGQIIGLPDHMNSRAGDLAGAAPGLFLPGFKDGGAIRPMWELQLEKAHQWAQARHGRPYVLGGSAEGGGGTDCSGFISGIANVIQGGNGARQWATMAFNGGGNAQFPTGPQGFVAGLGRGFSIGVTNGGAAGGHTAGTLSAVGPYGTVNVESGGSPSMVKYGTGAAGADHPQFATHYHLPIGADGQFESAGPGGGLSIGDMKARIAQVFNDAVGKILDPIKAKLPSGPPAWLDIPKETFEKVKSFIPDAIKDAVEALTDKIGTIFAALGKVPELVKKALNGGTPDVNEAAVYDTGGVLPHGGVAVNLSGKPEAILTNAQWQQFEALVNNLGDIATGRKPLTPAAVGELTETGKQTLAALGVSNDLLDGIEARVMGIKETAEKREKRIRDAEEKARDEARKVADTAVKGQLDDVRQVFGAPDVRSIPAVKAAEEMGGVMEQWADDNGITDAVGHAVSTARDVMGDAVSTLRDMVADSVLTTMDSAGGALASAASVALDASAQAVSTGVSALGAGVQAAGVPGAAQAGGMAGQAMAAPIQFIAQNTDEMYQLYRRSVARATAGVRGAR